ncbi:nucleotidyltransferase substrate binding protein, partial [[Clostridium] scindens]|uniref:nucleotidyltransferase substrate binding protein n=1 Tax=Clostridium scindens (strain JCM 10418 / VPI 12708) TaxID=29347 RepID=UPI003AB91F1B
MKKFDNFKKAYANLSLCRKYNEPYDVVTETGSPKMIMKLAYRAGMIKDEQAWLAMLDMRNTLAHSYNEDVAFDVIKHTK